MSERRRVFVDVEATGLKTYHQITEVAWRNVDTGERGLFVPPHTLKRANKYALKIQKYDERIAGQPVDDGTELDRFHAVLGGDGITTTFIAANPSYDTHMVQALFKRQKYAETTPWHHRKIDISNMAYTLFPEHFATGEVPGLKEVTELFGITQAKHHTAMEDVEVGTECYLKLEKIRETLASLLTVARNTE